jgi:hypothetical protein
MDFRVQTEVMVVAPGKQVPVPTGGLSSRAFNHLTYTQAVAIQNRLNVMSW